MTGDPGGRGDPGEACYEAAMQQPATRAAGRR